MYILTYKNTCVLSSEVLYAQPTGHYLLMEGSTVQGDVLSSEVLYMRNQQDIIIQYLWEVPLYIGAVKRLCLGNGEWGDVDTFSCQRLDLLQLQQTVSVIMCSYIM